MKHNFVAKHMNEFNKSKVFQNKKHKQKNDKKFQIKLSSIHG